MVRIDSKWIAIFPITDKCIVCEKNEEDCILYQCSKCECEELKYCSKECEKEHWAIHKEKCKKCQCKIIFKNYKNH